MSAKPIATETALYVDDTGEKKYTLRLGPQAAKDAEWIARKYGITIAEVFRRAISTEKYLLEQFEAGEVLILENKRTGRQRELAFR